MAGSDGQIGGAIILLHDLSHQKSAEHAVEGPAQLRLSPAGLAHEVKNPLTGIKGAAELLATIHPDDERSRQYCDVIIEGVESHRYLGRAGAGGQRAAPRHAG